VLSTPASDHAILKVSSIPVRRFCHRRAACGLGGDRRVDEDLGLSRKSARTKEPLG